MAWFIQGSDTVQVESKERPQIFCSPHSNREVTSVTESTTWKADQYPHAQTEHLMLTEYINNLD